MRIQYFASTDTLFIEFRESQVAETRDLDENTILDVDAQGNICAMTAELTGGAALIVGFMPRYVALVLIPLILGTIVTVHGKNGWMFSNKDGGWEFPAFWALALFVQFLLGDGAWALIASPHWF